MLLLDLLPNAAMFLVDGLAAALLHRERRLGPAVAVGAAGGLVTIAAAGVATGDGFAAMRVTAWVTFLHLPLLLVLAAALLRVVLSDLQTDDVGPYERAAFERAMAERPDLIVLPGDFVQAAPGRRAAELAKLRALLPILQAPLGVWAVQGNVDPPGWAAELFAGTGVRAAEVTTTVDLGPLHLSALSFADGFDPALVLPAAPGLHVAFAHGPDFALSPDVGADVLIAGHTHGGQVQLPLLGPPLVLSRISRRAGAGGATALAGGRTLMVSRGIGMERGRAPRLRFLCRPQIVVVDLVPSG